METCDCNNNNGKATSTVFPGYVSFTLSNLVPDTLTPCDVFFEAYSERLGRNSLILAIKKDHAVEALVLDDLASQGIVHSYAKQEDLDLLRQYLFAISSDGLSGLTKEERVELLFNSALCSIKAAMLEPRNGRRLAMGVRVVQKLVDTVYESFLTTKRLLGLMTVNQDIFQHCVKTCLLGAGFAQFLGWDKKDAEDLAIALFYHDLGLVVYSEGSAPDPLQIDLSLENKDIDHPTRSRDYLTQVPGINSRVLDTVQNHHEGLDGSGYPRGVGASQISDAARLAQIVDFYELHTSGEDQKNTPFAALHLMNTEYAPKLDLKLVQEFVVYLGRF